MVFSQLLFCWPAKLVCSQGMPAVVGGWGTRMNWGKEDWRVSFLIHWWWDESTQGDDRSFSAIHLIWGLGLDLQEQKKFGSNSHSTCYSGRSSPWVSRVCLLNLGTDAKQWVGWGRLDGKTYGTCRRWHQWGREGCHRCSAAELVVILENRIWRRLGFKREERKSFSGSRDLWVSRGNIVEFGVRIKRWIRRGRLGGDDLWEPQELWTLANSSHPCFH